MSGRSSGEGEGALHLDTLFLTLLPRSILLGAGGPDGLFFIGGVLSITARHPGSALRALRGGQPGRRACRAAACAAARFGRERGRDAPQDASLLAAVQCQASVRVRTTGYSHSRATHTWRVL